MVRYLLLYLDHNKFGAKACTSLSKANLKKLKTLCLSNTKINRGFNYIGDKGCELLVKGDWPKLGFLYLGFYSII